MSGGGGEEDGGKEGRMRAGWQPTKLEPHTEMWGTNIPKQHCHQLKSHCHHRHHIRNMCVLAVVSATLQQESSQKIVCCNSLTKGWSIWSWRSPNTCFLNFVECHFDSGPGGTHVCTRDKSNKSRSWQIENHVTKGIKRSFFKVVTFYIFLGFL